MKILRDAEILPGMKSDSSTTAAPLFLGIEGGGTRTVALLADEQGRLLQRAEAGPANVRLLSEAELVRLLQQLGDIFPKPAALAIGLAGAREEKDRQKIHAAAAQVWPNIPCYATHDLETALAAGGEKTGDRSQKPGERTARRANAGLASIPRVLVLSGTGSCCFGRTSDGVTAKVGGWGHILGDKGSGYEIGLRSLKATLFYFDRAGVWPALGQRILRALQLNEPNDLIAWAQQASKTDVAALAVEVFSAAANRDKIATDILAGAAHTLAKDAAACAHRLGKAGRPARFIFSGSVLLKQPQFAQRVGRELKKLWPKAIITPLSRESAWGAVTLAKEHFRFQISNLKPDVEPSLNNREAEVWQTLTLSPTEQRHPLSMNLDKLPLAEAIVLMLREDEKIPAALLGERKKIEQAVRLIVRAFRQGGRLFYVGAGSSGRLGVLDASECPPTFRTPPEQVQGIIAGGQRAIWSAVEGAEDDPLAGARSVEFREVGKRDVVVGIAASGRTPFVWGALRAAKARGATTLLVCFNPSLVIPREHRPRVVIAPNIGAEILTGSTRLKAGTATKLILNIFTTLAMVRLGKVLGNLMIDVKASNVKLRDRATRIVRELTGADYGEAQAALEKSDWQIKPACVRLKRRAG